VTTILPVTDTGLQRYGKRAPGFILHLRLGELEVSAHPDDIEVGLGLKKGKVTLCIW
jgi:hypothetical protein